MTTLNRRAPPVPPQGGIAPRSFEPSNTLRTHEGAPAAHLTPELALRRSVCSCLLWENEFYDSGIEIGQRIIELARQVPPQVLADLAADARSNFHLRHVPLLLAAVLSRTGAGSRLVSDTIAATIQRADELTEFLAVYAKVNNMPLNKIRPLSAQIKKGLARAYTKFDQYQFAKYLSVSGEREAPIKGRDVLFLTHAKPTDEEQAGFFKHIAEKLPIQEGGADTWEVGLSRAGSDKDAKRAVFERLLQDRKIGYLAVLRNLRNMTELGVDADLVRATILARRGGANRVLPFRFVAAARACPAFEPELGTALAATVQALPTLPGKTAVLVDVSSSMDAPLSARSDLTRMDAAATLAAVLPCERWRVFTFSNHCVEVETSLGPMSLIQTIKGSQPHQSTHLGNALNRLAGRVSQSGWGSVSVEQLEPVAMDRLVVITDEQSHDFVQAIPGVRCYLINVASYRNGVGYGENFVHLDGFSEQVIRWIVEYEKL